MFMQKQLWVRPETHELCRELADRARKTMKDVVEEALQGYKVQLEQKEEAALQQAVAEYRERKQNN